MIRDRMEVLGMSQRKLAERTGVHLVSINRFLRGKSKMESDSVQAIMRVLDATGIEWRNGHDERRRPHGH